MTTRGLGRVYRPTRKCERCRGQGCERCESGRRQIATWTVQYSHKGRQYRESSGSTRRSDAVGLLRKRLSEMAPGRRFLGPQSERITFEELMELVLSDYRANQRRSTRRVVIARKRLAKAFEGLWVIEITTDRITQYIERRLSDGVAGATVRNELNALRRGFRLARQADRISHIPHFPAIAANQVRSGFFEESEFRRVVEHLPHGLQPIAEFGYLSGWRISEIPGLRWHQVDLHSGVVRLEAGTTKNDEGRVLPFYALPALKDLLLRQRQRTDRKERQYKRVLPWVFHRRAKKILRIDGAWKRACERAGCAGKLFHDLRRTAVRNLERAAVPRSVAMKITGHKTESVYRRYAIVNERDLAEGLGKLAKTLGQGVS